MRIGATAALLAFLLCAPLQAQNIYTDCLAAEPTPVVVGNAAQDLPRLARATRPPGSGTISVRALTSKPLKSARKEFDRGIHAWQKGKIDEELNHLTEALRLDPTFVDALIELGGVYAEMGRPELALVYFDRALALEPNLALPYIAKASALLLLARPAEAELAARLALKLEPLSIEASYMLGTSLLMQQKATPEVAAYLAAAAGRYPKARDLLAELQKDPVKNPCH